MHARIDIHLVPCRAKKASRANHLNGFDIKPFLRSNNSYRAKNELKFTSSVWTGLSRN